MKNCSRATGMKSNQLSSMLNHFRVRRLRANRRPALDLDRACHKRPAIPILELPVLKHFGTRDFLGLLQSATSRDCPRRINIAIALLDIRNLSIHVDQKRGAVGQERLFAQYSILLRDHPFVIGQHRKRRAQLFGPMI